MTTYFVATMARYVLVKAENEHHARELGHAALHKLYADLREHLGREVPINIQTVRPATDDEIELWRWHHEKLAEERLVTSLPGQAPAREGFCRGQPCLLEHVWLTHLWEG